MRTPNRHKFFILSIVLLTLFLISLNSGGASSPPRSWNRSEDFVVLSGKQLISMIGAGVEELRLYSCRGSSCSPIPGQVDKIDSSGRYVFPGDKQSDPHRDGNLLDPNDEISFMASDAGDKRPAGFKPKPSVRGAEVELTDPLDGQKAFVYIFDEPGARPAKLPDYVDYKIDGDNTTIVSPQFVMSWKTGGLNYDTIKMKTPAGKIGPDVLDKQRVGMEAQMLSKDLALNVPESLVRAVDLAVIDGPIRVIIDQVVMLNLANISLQWGTEYYIKYYRCGQNNSVNFSFPMRMDKLFKSITFYWSLDFNDQILGSKYYDQNHSQPLTIDERVRKSVPEDQPHYWWGLAGQNGALFQALDLDKEMFDFFGCNGLWRQDKNAVSKNSDHPERLEIGFSCGEKGKMPEKQTFHWFNYILVPADPSPAGLKAMQNLVEHPLEVKIEKLP